MNTTDHENYIIFYDSVITTSTTRSTDKQPNKILELQTALSNKHQNIMLCWLPSHVCIKGKEAADRAEKDTLTSAVSITEVLAPDWKLKVMQFVQNIRNRNWEEIQSNKLKEIVPNLKNTSNCNATIERDEAVLTRLRIGHSRLIH